MRWRVQFASGEAPERIQKVVQQVLERNGIDIAVKVLETSNGEYFVLFADTTACGPITHGLLKEIDRCIIDTEVERELERREKINR